MLDIKTIAIQPHNLREYPKHQTHAVVDGRSLKSAVCVLTKPVFNSSNSFSFILCARFCSYSDISYKHEKQIDITVIYNKQKVSKKLLQCLTATHACFLEISVVQVRTNQDFCCPLV